MEVVLLWLDDLDDALFSLAMLWERLRRVVLQVGLASAVSLAALELSATGTTWSPALSYVALASVGSWFAGAALRALYYRDASRNLTPA